jgi:uncharacterized protein (DUF849 family)
MIFGILGGIDADLENLLFMKRTADKLFGDRLSLVCPGSRSESDGVLYSGRAARRERPRRPGGQPLHRQRKLAASNAEQVRKIRRILEELGHEIATPAEAREMLALKGGDRVGF